MRWRRTARSSVRVSARWRLHSREDPLAAAVLVRAVRERTAGPLARRPVARP
ncbi:hypothetical protein KPATCC21470_8529 [Kitasatospora purpeofusca]